MRRLVIPALMVAAGFALLVLLRTGDSAWAPLPGLHPPDRPRLERAANPEEGGGMASPIPQQDRTALALDAGEEPMELGSGPGRIDTAPVHGRILDQGTGEPVPDLLLEIRGPRSAVRNALTAGDERAGAPPASFELPAPPRRIEDVVTDADGRFTTSGGFEAGLLDLVLVDHPSFLRPPGASTGEPARVEHAHVFDDSSPPEEVQLRIPIGPTYRLDLRLPPGEQLESFFATFPLPQSHHGFRELHRAFAGDVGSPMALLFRSGSNPEGLEQRAPLREGEPLWVRFRLPLPAIIGRSGAAGNRELHVRSRDGLWAGQAPVASVEGIQREVVPITLERCGGIEGRVRDGDGQPLPTAWARLFAPSAPLEPAWESSPDAMGRFRLLWLPEGTYGVVVETDLHEPWRSAVQVAQGSITRIEVRLGQARAHGTISGVLRSRTGRHRSKGGTLALVSLDDPGFGFVRTATYRRRDGEYVAPFSFEDVPSGEYELTLRPLDNLRWDKLRILVSPPAEGLEFLCEDTDPTFDLELRAIDAESGARIERTWSIVWQGDPLDEVRLDDDWETKLYEGVPEGVALRWVLRAQGYRLATGDESDLLGTRGQRFVEARLRPGWGQLFKVTTRDRVPLEGVELLADGKRIGSTDALGRVALDLDTKPEALEFRYEDWVVTWGGVDPSEDGFGWGPETPVYMGPGK